MNSYQSYGTGHQVSLPPGKEYRYTEIADNEIRLLKLHDVPPNGDIYSELRGELLTFTLTIFDEADNTDLSDSVLMNMIDENKEAPTFDAISYTWGGDDPTAKEGRKHGYIQLVEPGQSVENRATGSYLVITANLESALRRFRIKLKTRKEPLYLWMDAVCINQKSDVEKSAQIRKMADIYSSASLVRIWLGNEEKDSKLAFDFIQRILSLEDFDDIVQDPATSDEWNAFRNIMQKSWFKRRWIIQEVAFARRAKLYCGRNSVPWDEVASAMTLFASKSDSLRQMFQRTGHPDYLGEINAYGAKTLVDTIKRMFRRSEFGDIMEYHISLESLITTLTSFDAKLPHDCVYAIMRLSCDARPGSHASMYRVNSSSLHALSQRMYTPEASPAGNVILKSSDNDSEARMHTASENFGGITSSSRPDTPESHPHSISQDLERGRTPQRQETFLAAPATGARCRSRSRSPSPAAAKRNKERKYRKPLKTFIVDYKKSMFQLSTEVVKFAAEQSKSIDMICKPWVPSLLVNEPGDTRQSHEDDQKAMPSWLQPLAKRPYAVSPKSDDKRYTRVQANPLVGTCLSGLKCYSASGNVPIPDDFLPPKGTLISGRILNARGFILDEIEETTDPALNAVIPATWLHFGDWNDQKQIPPEPFWRTLVANRESSDGPQEPPEYWRYACRWAFARRPESGNLDTKELIMNILGKTSTPVVEFLNRVQAVIWNRKLIRSKGHTDQHGEYRRHPDFLGLAPREAQKGDKICILYGCSVPVLLRPKGKAKIRRVNTTGGGRGTRWRGGAGFRSGRNSRAASPSRVTNASSTATNVPSFSITADIGAVSQKLDSVYTSQISQEPSTTPAPSAAAGSAGRTPSPLLETYTLVGECYVHGMMDGEAFEQQEWWNLHDRNFRIGCVENCDCDSECCK